MKLPRSKRVGPQRRPGRFSSAPVGLSVRRGSGLRAPSLTARRRPGRGAGRISSRAERSRPVRTRPRPVSSEGGCGTPSSSPPAGLCVGAAELTAGIDERESAGPDRVNVAPAPLLGGPERRSSLRGGLAPLPKCCLASARSNRPDASTKGRRRSARSVGCPPDPS